MVPPEMRQLPHVSFTQLDQYLRCPLRYRFTYVDRLEPEFLPAALAFGSGIHGAAAFLSRGLARGARPSLADVQGYFESVWNLEAAHRPLRFGEKDTPASLLDLGTRMLAVLCDRIEPATEVVAVEEPFAVPLIDQETGEILDRDLVGTLDLLDRDATKTKQPELHRYWTRRDRAANRRLFRLVAEVLHAIEAGVFHPNPGWHCKDCPFRNRWWAWGKGDSDPRGPSWGQSATPRQSGPDCRRG